MYYINTNVVLYGISMNDEWPPSFLRKLHENARQSKYIFLLSVGSGLVVFSISGKVSLALGVACIIGGLCLLFTNIVRSFDK